MAYSIFSSEDIVLSSEKISAPMWSNGTATLTRDSIETSPAQLLDLSSDYYIDYYYSGSEEVQFACTFADKYGRGAYPYNSSVPENTPSRTIFGQYRTLVLGDEESDFYLGTSGSANQVSSSFFWAISVDRSRYKESLLPGTLQLELQVSGSSDTLMLLDNSLVQNSVQYIDSGRVYKLIRGVQELGEWKPDMSALDEHYGYFLPDIGTILLDGHKIQSAVIKDSPDVSQQIFDGNGEPKPDMDITKYIEAFRNAINSFTLQSAETVTSNYVFIRVKNSEFNYSMNPSNITSTGELRYKVMANSPETYITSVGLYNNNNDLVAVAKLSKPLPKNFTKEALIRIKLDY